MRQLWKRNENDPLVAIVVLIQREPHAGQMAFREVAQPTSFEERRVLAERCRVEFDLPIPMLIDGMDDASRALFSDLPSPAFIIDPSGMIRDKLPWGDAEPIALSLERLAKEGLLSPPASAEGETTPFGGAVRDRARRALATGNPSDAANLLRRVLAAIPKELDPTAAGEVAELRALLAIAAAATDADDAATRLAEARAAIAADGATDTALRAARLAEVAGTVRDPSVRRAVYAEALAALSPKAPESMRTWLKARATTPDVPPTPR